MNLKQFLRRYSWTSTAVVAALALVLVLVAYCIERRGAQSAPEPEPTVMYGIEVDDYEMVEGEVAAGETVGRILSSFGIGVVGTHRIEVAARDSFDLRRVRAGNRYIAFMEADSLGTRRLAHFVYERSKTEYVVISLPEDGEVVVQNGQKPIRTERLTARAEIGSSMWNAIVGNGYPVEIFTKMEDIFGWSVDFFGIRAGDSFEVIYDQHWVDSVKVGIGNVWGAVFTHNGKPYYAIPFKQEGKIAYWDENGNSLKKQFLKAPLKYSRISSYFSHARRHPITRVVRPHHGVDYAAPVGTPVHAVADGTVTRKYWDTKGGGNTVWVKHARGYETGYLHLSRFAAIAVGGRVSQGQTLGYVGSTGASTGPHLDYRIRVNGKPVNPLTIPQEPGLPIKERDRTAFAVVRDKVKGELAGTLPHEDRLVQLDSVAIPKGGRLAAVTPSPIDTVSRFPHARR